MTDIINHPPQDRERIKSVPGVCSGEPCFTGTRIPVRVVRMAVIDRIAQSYPTLEVEDIIAALQYPLK